ncbi:unnamed protein product [Prunus armeniaca]|uniref:Uncharacterized protein n=1 Tax=Prunus armeniaca TaxID=36596 RepID=A0A6J5VM21_PRUAR|nr:unnamed protein product [Prunus armeniaca]CAB4320524.1 unnamed protein product [Prunus armeniaca]
MRLSTTPFRFALNTFFLLPLPLAVWAGPSPYDLGLGQTLPDGPGQVILGPQVIRMYNAIRRNDEIGSFAQLEDGSN